MSIASNQIERLRINADLSGRQGAGQVKDLRNGRDYFGDVIIDAAKENRNP